MTSCGSDYLEVKMQDGSEINTPIFKFLRKGSGNYEFTINPSADEGEAGIYKFSIFGYFANASDNKGTLPFTVVITDSCFDAIPTIPLNIVDSIINYNVNDSAALVTFDSSLVSSD